jgi:hypothetical protein
LAVRNGVAYIVFDVDGAIMLASNPSGDQQGPWNIYSVFPNTTQQAGNPSVAIAGDTLAVAISAANRDKGFPDVFVSTVPLSALGASTGGSLAWQTVDVTQDDTKRDDNPYLTADDGSLALAWARNGWIEVNFARGQPGGPLGSSWASPPEQVATTGYQFGALQLAASHGRAVMGRMFQMKDGIETWGSINAKGAWSSQMLGLEANSPAYDEVGAAFSRCGASLSFIRYAGIPDAGEYKVQPTVATFAGGQWSQQDIGPIRPFAGWAEIAPTEKGLGLVFQTSQGPEVDLWTAEGTCYQSSRKPPAVAH